MDHAAYAEQQMFVLVIMLLLGLLVQVAFLAVALTTVRRASPDAASWLAGAAIVSMISAVTHPVATVVVSRLMSPEDLLRGTMMVTVSFALVGLATACAQLFGIVRLAESRRRE